MAFLDDDFLLTNEPAKQLFHQYAADLPIIDFHCHLNPQEIYENRNLKNITRIWLNEGTYGDHYKWRLERANGVPEELITGDGDDYEKFVAWCKTMENAWGNPVFEWTHLELRRFFGSDLVLSRDTAKKVWDLTNAKLATPEFTPRALIRRSHVEVVCTTDDPASDLHYHELIANDEDTNGFKVLPAMRPDKLMAICANTYGDYLQTLGKAAGVEITDFASLKKAMKQRFTFFAEHGGHLSDHGLNSFHYRPVDQEALDTIIKKGIENRPVSDVENDQYLTGLVEMLMDLNREFNWTMQFHANVDRSLSLPNLKKIGPDTGFDAMGSQPDLVGEFRDLFQAMDARGPLPKVIFYSLNPNDWLPLITMLQSFVGQGDKQHLQLGAAWWFNDTAEGMHRQLQTFAQQSLLPNFVGMLTDSRSFLSYPRHEYFRRVLCNFYGELVEQGRVPYDLDALGRIIKNISYGNAHDYFGFYDNNND